MTPIQIREKLASIAGQLITEEQVTRFKDLLTLKSTPNGGNAVTDDLKYTGLASHFLRWYVQGLTPFIVQLNSLGKMACMFRPPFSGMVWLPTKFLALGEKKSGPNFLQRMLLSRCEELHYVGYEDKFDVIFVYSIFVQSGWVESYLVADQPSKPFSQLPNTDSKVGLYI